MLKFYLLIFVSIFIFPDIIHAQNNTAQITGRIILPNNDPASYVNVKLKNMHRTVIANENGAFVIAQLPALTDSLIISGIGFKTLQTGVIVMANEKLNLGSIQIQLTATRLQNVEIIGSNSHSYKSDYSFAASKTQALLIDIPQSLSTTTKELITDKMQLHLNQALENIPGVTHYSGYEEYNIRGLHAENARLINGLRSYNTSLTSPLLVNIERVELIKGPAAVLYGNCDPGGTINMVTKKPLADKQYSISLGTGSWNAFNGQLDATGTLNPKATWLYRLNAGFEKTRSFRNGYFLNAYQIAPSVSFIPNNRLRVNLDISFANTHSVVDRGQPGLEDSTNLLSTPIKLSVIQPNDYLTESNLSAVLSATYQINKRISFNTSLLHYNTTQKLSEHGIEDYISSDSVYLNYNYRKINTQTNTFSNYFSFDLSSREIKQQLLVGYEFISNNVNLHAWEGALPAYGTGTPLVGSFSLLHPQYVNRNVAGYQQVIDTASGEDIANAIYNTHGVYVQDYLTYRKWKLLAGLRAEFYTAGIEEDANASINKLLPRLGITYAINKNLRIYTSYNSGFDPFEPSSVIQVFNQPFKPVTSYMFEAGAKASLLKNKVFGSIAFYQINIKNLAVNANDNSNPNLFVQRGEQQSRGMELELQGNFNKNLSANINYAYNQTAIIKSIKPEDLGKIAENAPKHSSSSWLKYQFFKGPLDGWGISLGHAQSSERNTLDPAIKLPGYCIWNSGIQYSVQRFRIAINLNNLFNTTYWASAYNNINKWPGAPRNFMARIQYTF
jgi:iron complex outermembrane receptor protein